MLSMPFGPLNPSNANSFSNKEGILASWMSVAKIGQTNFSTLHISSGILSEHVSTSLNLNTVSLLTICWHFFKPLLQLLLSGFPHVTVSISVCSWLFFCVLSWYPASSLEKKAPEERWWKKNTRQPNEHVYIAYWRILSIEREGGEGGPDNSWPLSHLTTDKLLRVRAQVR